MRKLNTEEITLLKRWLFGRSQMSQVKKQIKEYKVDMASLLPKSIMSTIFFQAEGAKKC